MTDNAINHHPDPHIDAVPGAAKTHVLYAGFAAGLNALRAMIGHRGCWGMLKTMRKKLRELFNTERDNFELWLRHSLSRDRAWRSRVLNDLGGERALRLWERRAARVRDNQPAVERLYSQTQTSRNRDANTPRPGIKTDALGLFRLAPVTKQTAKSSTRSASSSYRSASSSPLFPDLKPIGLTPDELRCGDDRSNTQAEFTRASIAPHDLWASLMGRIMRAFDYMLGIEADMLSAMVAANAPTIQTAPPMRAVSAKDANADHSITHPD